MTCPDPRVCAAYGDCRPEPAPAAPSDRNITPADIDGVAAMLGGPVEATEADVDAAATALGLEVIRPILGIVSLRHEQIYDIGRVAFRLGARLPQPASAPSDKEPTP